MWSHLDVKDSNYSGFQLHVENIHLII